MDTDLEGRREGVFEEFRGVADEIENRMRVHVEHEEDEEMVMMRSLKEWSGHQPDVYHLIDELHGVTA